jgi:hypothetical protein
MPWMGSLPFRMRDKVSNTMDGRKGRSHLPVALIESTNLENLEPTLDPTLAPTNKPKSEPRSVYSNKASVLRA